MAETKRKIRLHFLAHLQFNLVLGSAKWLSHGLSQKVKSPIVLTSFSTWSSLAEVNCLPPLDLTENVCNLCIFRFPTIIIFFILVIILLDQLAICMTILSSLISEQSQYSCIISLFFLTIHTNFHAFIPQCNAINYQSQRLDYTVTITRC